MESLTIALQDANNKIKRAKNYSQNCQRELAVITGKISALNASGYGVPAAIAQEEDVDTLPLGPSGLEETTLPVLDEKDVFVEDISRPVKFVK